MQDADLKPASFTKIQACTKPATCCGADIKCFVIMQAGTVVSHPVQKERHLEHVVNKNPYQHALLRMHQARYQPAPHRQLALLQVIAHI